jgi:glyoxylase-like metal-dependent hydrolase (beta-lactamase superfamily II)
LVAPALPAATFARKSSAGYLPQEIIVTVRVMLVALASTVLIPLGACSPKSESPAGAEGPAASAPSAIAAFPETADVKPFTIGALQAAALRDGGLSVPNDNKILAINKTKQEVADLLTANGLSPETIDLSVQPLLVRTADKVLLFDTGAGKMFGPTMGKLPATMATAGIDPASVTDIFISHSHGDHVGGLVKSDNTLTFPNAAIHISANEVAFLKSSEGTAALVTAITPKVVEFQPNAELIPGVVKAVDIKGHTPGHSGYLITSEGQSLLYIGDTMHHFVISVQQPDWTIMFDSDAPTAQASRKAVLESSAAAGQRIFAVHFPFPGVGKFEKQGDKVVWVAEP